MCALILPCCDFASTEEMIVGSILCKETWRIILFVNLKVVRQNWWLFTIQATSSFEGHLKQSIQLVVFRLA